MNQEQPSSFPRGRDVPFPLERPYPQQVDLMDAILQSLQAHQLRQQHQRKQQQQQQPAQQDEQSNNTHRALVMMLESPTGTGKSLSLACAAMTWLRYMEQQDAAQDHPNNDDVTKQNETKSHDEHSPTAVAATEWWNAWVPLDAQEEQHRAEQGRKTARATRHALQQELDLLRQKLQPTSASRTAPTTALSHGNSSSTNHDAHHHPPNNVVGKNQHRERRENLVRSSVTTAKMIEKKQQQQRLQQQSKRKGIIRPSKRLQQIRDENTIDYCVHEYHSDADDDNDNNNNNNNDRNHNDDDDEENEHHLSAASKLETYLNGAYLDGSVRTATTTSHFTPRAKDSAASAAVAAAATMGSVQPGSGVRKIFYAARTHSQLSQMVRELQRTEWGRDVRVVALGGRQLLCQNPAVNTKSRSETAISEACLDLQKNGSSSTSGSSSGTSSTAVNTIIAEGEPTSRTKRKSSSNKDVGGSGGGGGCPFMASRSAVSTLALHLLAQPSDIEDAARLGNASQTCAYYASRKSLAAAEVVVLPYNMLLSQQAREAVGLSLKGAFIIIDEAHNLPEALRALHSSKVSLPVAEAALAQLSAYTARYATRLAGRNLHYLGHLRRILIAMNQYLKRDCRTSNINRSVLMSPEELLVELRLDHINLFKVLRYLKNSKLSQKLLGFVNQTTVAGTSEATEGANDNNVDSRIVSKHVSAMAPVQSFLEKLVMTSGEGKVVTDWPSDGEPNRVTHPTLRYVLLQPAAHFDHILQEAHAVALVGGTLRPFAHMGTELLSADSDYDLLREAKRADDTLERPQQHGRPLPSSSSATSSSSSCSTTLVAPRWVSFTCDHVVPRSHVRLECIGRGPTNVPLDFRHTSRNANHTCDELARVLIKTCQTVPAGVVVFVPSYSYEAHLVQRWKLTGSWQELAKYKRLHREPKTSQQVEETLAAYGKDANKTGALLLSVIGGKMSEGINFADNMARCVVVVGLPYPDSTDPVLLEKMKLLDQTMKQSGPPGTASSMITGQSYYQNLCLRAINQSVGRAIRHAKDYAAILLCDVRYTTDERIWSGLPQWLRRSGSGDGRRSGGTFSTAIQRLEEFFREKANST